MTVRLDAEPVPYQLHAYHHDPAVRSFGTEAAEALGLPPEQVFKTLLTTVDDCGTNTWVAAMVPVSGRLDLRSLAAVLGVKKVTLADPVDAQRRTGYVIGGMAPLGSRQAHRTVIDSSALTFPTIFCSAGRRGLDVELAPQDLVRLADAVVAAIALTS